MQFYGKSFHDESHGESFLRMLKAKLSYPGLFLLDEPEAALSLQRQLSLLILMHDTLQRNRDSQFIIASHSPFLLAYPEAQICSFDGDHIHEIQYQQTDAYQIGSRFLADPENFLQGLFSELDFH